MDEKGKDEIQTVANNLVLDMFADRGGRGRRF